MTRISPRVPTSHTIQARRVKSSASAPALMAMEGFTLIETMTVLAVVAILAGCAMPAMARWVQNAKADSAVASLSADLALARLNAMTHQRPVTLCPSSTAATCSGGSDWSRGWIVFEDTNQDHVKDSDEKLLQTHHIEAGTGVSVTSSQGRRIVAYSPRGATTGSNITVTVCTSQRMRSQVIVNNSGRARVQRAAGNTGAPCPNT